MTHAAERNSQLSEASNTDTDTETSSPSQQPRGLVKWLVDPEQRRFILPATGLWILVLDWLLFSSNLLSAWLATPVVMLLGFVLGSTGTFLVQRKAAQDSLWSAAAKAVLAGVLVGLPWPIGGTLVGGWVLLTSGLGDARKEILRR
jgi:hypothetical protein